MTAPADVTQLLALCREGDPEALERLFPVVYAELRRLARRQLDRERAGHTLQPTALVHEAYLKLVDQRSQDWQNRRHFLALAATAMRRVLVHHAEKRAAKKRGGDRGRVTLFEAAGPTEERAEDLVELDRALDRLAELDERAAQVVELRFFAGLSGAEAARVLEVSERTIERDWRSARAWLRQELGAEGA